MLSPQAFYILVALAAGDLHGYAIIKEVEEITEGAMALLPGTLYRLVKQFSSDGWIVEVAAPAPDGDPRRRYYRLTGRGRALITEEAVRLDSMVRLAKVRRLLPAGV